MSPVLFIFIGLICGGSAGVLSGVHAPAAQLVRIEQPVVAPAPLAVAVQGPSPIHVVQGARVQLPQDPLVLQSGAQIPESLLVRQVAVAAAPVAYAAAPAVSYAAAPAISYAAAPAVSYAAAPAISYAAAPAISYAAAPAISYAAAPAISYAAAAPAVSLVAAQGGY